MPIPTHVFDPPFNIIRSSHIVLDVTDLKASRSFYETTVGLHVEDADNSVVYLRGSEEHQHHSLVLRKAQTPACNRIGFKVGNEGDLDKAAAMRPFGPFLTVIPFRDEAHAIEIANDVNYGLTGYVWTGDMGRALRVADALEAGMIWLNSKNVRHLPTPFGGMKSSGIGRDGGDYSFDFYMETKHVSLARGTHKIQKLGI